MRNPSMLALSAFSTVSGGTWTVLNLPMQEEITRQPRPIHFVTAVADRVMELAEAGNGRHPHVTISMLFAGQ